MKEHTFKEMKDRRDFLFSPQERKERQKYAQFTPEKFQLAAADVIHNLENIKRANKIIAESVSVQKSVCPRANSAAVHTKI